MSTSLALLELTEEITSALDKKKSTISVFIDLKKAVDTIDHTLLRHYGVRGVANDSALKLFGKQDAIRFIW